jgi:hypothetical protein
VGSFTPLGMKNLWLRLPFLVVTICLGVALLCAIAVRWSETLPISPWEPAIAMEGVRLDAGLPVYETGHATHIYGPLLTGLIAAVFRLFGFNLLAARIVFSLFGLALAILLTILFCRRGSAFYCFFGLLLFLAVNFRANLIFLTAQPDCAALFFATLALYLWATRGKSWMRWTSSLALFLAALLTKQTAAALALVPFVYTLLWTRPLGISAIAQSLVPGATIVAALGAIRWFWPEVYFAMVTVPAAINVNWGNISGMTIYLLGTFPLFIVALLATLRLTSQADERERWIWAAILVLVPVSIWTICKSGGSYNSFLPAYLAMTALFVVKLDAILQWLNSLSAVRGFLASTVIALAILLSIFVQFDRDWALLFTRSGDERRSDAIVVARNLGPGVISPQDPSIAYLTNGYFGRSIYFELDSHSKKGNWPDQLPESMKEELAGAKYVLQVKNYVPTRVFDDYLRAGQFKPMSFAQLEGSAYTIWAKQ